MNYCTAIFSDSSAILRRSFTETVVSPSCSEERKCLINTMRSSLSGLSFGMTARRPKIALRFQQQYLITFCEFLSDDNTNKPHLQVSSEQSQRIALSNFLKNLTPTFSNSGNSTTCQKRSRMDLQKPLVSLQCARNAFMWQCTIMHYLQQILAFMTTNDRALLVIRWTRSFLKFMSCDGVSEARSLNRSQNEY